MYAIHAGTDSTMLTPLPLHQNNLHDIVEHLSRKSLGTWWDTPIDSNRPVVNFDSTNKLADNDEFDPHNWYLHNCKKEIEEMLKQENKQSDVSENYEDLQYDISRMSRERWPKITLTDTDGLAAGYEESILQQNILANLVKKELFHNIAVFLYTRAPKYWRNGQARIWLINRIP